MKAETKFRTLVLACAVVFFTASFTGCGKKEGIEDSGTDKYDITLYDGNGDMMKKWFAVERVQFKDTALCFEVKDGKEACISGTFTIIEQDAGRVNEADVKEEK